MPYFAPVQVDLSGLEADIATRAVKGPSGAAGHVAALDAQGDLADSGYVPSDFAVALHTHDDRYFTEAEVTALLAGKAPLASPAFTGTLTFADALVTNNGISSQTNGYSLRFNAYYDPTANGGVGAFRRYGFGGATRMTVGQNFIGFGVVTTEDAADTVVTFNDALVVRPSQVEVDGTLYATTFNGSGASLTSIPAGQLTGSIADARLSSNVPLKNQSNTFTGSITATGFVGNGSGLTNLPNRFNQSLNTGDSVAFVSVVASSFVGDGSAVTVTYRDWENVADATAPLSDIGHSVDSLSHAVTGINDTLASWSSVIGEIGSTYAALAGATFTYANDDYADTGAVVTFNSTNTQSRINLTAGGVTSGVKQDSSGNMSLIPPSGGTLLIERPGEGPAWFTLSAADGNASFSGNVTAANLSGTNTGDQDLSAFVTGSTLTEALAGYAALSGAAFGGTVTAVGPVGIGTTDPLHPLHVVGDGFFNDDVIVNGDVNAATFTGNLTGNVTGNVTGGTVGGTSGTFSGTVTAATFSGSGASLTSVNAATLNSHADTYFATAAGLTSHTGNTSNPHGVTAAQVGAYTTSAADTLLAAKAPLASPTFTGTATAPKYAISNGTTSANGIDFGSDVNLYRSGANVLKTDDSFQCANLGASGFIGATAIQADTFADYSGNGIVIQPGFQGTTGKHLQLRAGDGDFGGGSVKVQNSGGTSVVEVNTTGVGFFAVTPVGRQGATTDIKDALTNYGLLQGTSASPLNLDGGAITAGAITSSGTVTATTFSGSGASLTSIPQSAVTSLTSDLSAKAPLASPSFTGTVTAPSVAVTGNFAAKVVSKTSAYTLATTETVCLVDATSGAVTITLPAASGATDRQYVVKKTDATANAVTVGRTGSDTIDGATSQSLVVQYQSATLVSNGTNWFII